MPELPEMETYKVLLEQIIGGQMITGVVINREKSINVPIEEFTRKVLHQKIESIERRAKYVIFRLQNGFCLLLHLMLGGWMYYGTKEEQPDRSIQVQLSFQDHHLYFIGLRLGYLHLHTPEMIWRKLQHLGPEPLDPNFSLDAFFSIFQNRRGGLKTTLMNQEVLSGIGSRYSDEILWHCQLHPKRRINELEPSGLVRLYGSIQSILQLAMQHGGYMDPLYRDDHKTGGYQMFVHGVEGKNCSRCGNMIVKADKMYFCQQCQL
ncbi:Fpg/Nei family DNA glycosylase [Siminovitchia sediminis]|uniref:Fpg/Nei family DNA glycosylase n=1 Tax=Siminovitchia sediminis TaxID=1274353 RepID=A0ABW4KFM0_9BACI